MGGYIYGIVAAAVFVFIILSLSPDGPSGELGKYVGFAGALAVMLAMILPLPGVINESEELITEAEAVTADRTEKTGEYHATIAAEALFQIYGVEKEKVRARVYTDQEGEIAELELIIPGGEGVNAADAGKLLSEICSFKVIVKEADDGS